MLMRNFKFGFCVTLLLISCGKPSVPPLAEIEQVKPETLEPGDVLRIHGSGFVEGTVDVILDGSFKPAGPGPSSLRKLKLVGFAVSKNDIEISLPLGTMKQLTEEPVTFDGSIETDFSIPSGVVRIFAKQDNIHLNLDPGGAGVALRSRKKREAESHLQAAGIRLVSAKEVDGLVVAEVVEGSAADKAGIEFGDRLLAVDDRALAEVADLAEAAPSQAHMLDIVTRQGLMQKVFVGPALTGYLDGDELFAVILSSIALGLFLAFVAPSGRRCCQSTENLPDPFVNTIGIGLISLFLCLIPAIALFLYSGVLLWLLLFGCHAAGIIGLYLKAPKQRFFSLLKLGTVPTLVIAAAYLSSAANPLEIVTAQQKTTLGPHILMSPFALLLGAMSLFLIRPFQKSDAEDVTSTVLEWLCSVSVASAVSICFLGGWSVPSFFAHRSLAGSVVPALSCVVFLVKTWLVLAASRSLVLIEQVERRSSSGKYTKSVLSLLLLVVFGAATVFWEAAKIPDAVHAAGQVLAAGMFVTLVSGLIALSVKAFLLGSSTKKDPKRSGLPNPPPTSATLHSTLVPSLIKIRK